MTTLSFRSVHSVMTRVSDRMEAFLLRRSIPRGPVAPRETYLRLHEGEVEKEYPEITRFEEQAGFSIERQWLDDLALTTQVSVKASGVCYQHGRILYSALRRYIEETGERDITVVETGTARGFSAICMARALADAGVDGRIVTIDMIPHDMPMYWNCVADQDGPKSRRELLKPWANLSQCVAFLQGRTDVILPRLSLTRVNFAFLDASHTRSDVLFEFANIDSAQEAGDVMVFDDYTPQQFPGVVAAVDYIAEKNCERVERIASGEHRGYARLVRI